MPQPDPRFDAFIQTKRLQCDARSQLEWYGLIVLNDSGPFEFQLVLFDGHYPFLYQWDASEGTLTLLCYSFQRAEGWTSSGGGGLSATLVISAFFATFFQ
jgi:hypothetical protein